MKKFIVLILFSFIVLPSFASNWVEIFEKQYVDFESIELYPKPNIISFWVKSLRKDPKDKFFDIDYWYSLNKMSISCNARFSRTEAINVYDLKKQLIYSDSTIPDWNSIAPDTYADGYYRLFCLLPFNQNPLLNGGKK